MSTDSESLHMQSCLTYAQAEENEETHAELSVCVSDVVEL